ncbi:hypothetical protein LQR31_13095 [Chromobacterium vaccinii]|uniref:WD40/YVTN/BNR-like repeat-containing protein n=1 Tax=Chromobacterium vaccinii TaxID=1108595 RepID=UPI001E5115A9|nr:hypothetical protein [Chromobacterium vaccinii]MCD4485406.1 hypothetical protein [Chromobacterium vaccinii]
MAAKSPLSMPLNLLRALFKWLLIAIFGLALLGAGAYGIYRILSMWTYETDLMEHDKPYGGGDMRIHGRSVMVFKPIGPEITFKKMTEEERKHPEKYNSVVTEPWMNDSSERLNRHTVRLLRGDMDKGIYRIFEKPGQNGAWWLSPDWQTIYVSTDWTNYRLPNGPDGYGQRQHTLWKSIDGGQNWRQLQWPEHTQPGQPLFMADGKRGYLVADGMRIWRTLDGGEHWQEIVLPSWANQQLTGHPSGNGLLPMVKDSRATFSAYDLADDGALRVAFYVRKAKLATGIGDVTESTLLYRLPLSASQDELARKWMQPEIVLPQQSVMDIKASRDGSLNLIALQGELQSEKVAETQQRLAAYVQWKDGKESYRHVFDTHVAPGALFIGPQNQLVLAAESQDPKQTTSDSITLVSVDQGRSWDETNDGMAYAWYYEGERNRIWKYQLQSLYWRELK